MLFLEVGGEFGEGELIGGVSFVDESFEAVGELRDGNLVLGVGGGFEGMGKSLFNKKTENVWHGLINLPLSGFYKKCLFESLVFVRI